MLKLNILHAKIKNTTPTRNHGLTAIPNPTRQITAQDLHTPRRALPIHPKGEKRRASPTDLDAVDPM